MLSLSLRGSENGSRDATVAEKLPLSACPLMPMGFWRLCCINVMGMMWVKKNFGHGSRIFMLGQATS